MTGTRDKDMIEHWLRLYSCLTGSKFKVEDWPDRDSSKKNIDAICRGDNGQILAVEHTLIEPYVGERSDAARFSKTLASLENHPDLVLPGYALLVTQPVDSIPTGINWEVVKEELLRQLRDIVRNVPEGDHAVDVTGANWMLSLQINKMRTKPSDPGRFLTGRSRDHSGDLASDAIVIALKKKAPKLSNARSELRRQSPNLPMLAVLLLEKNAVGGAPIESLFAQLPEAPEVRALMGSVDEIWAVYTAGVEFGNGGVIHANQLMPATDRNFSHCQLNLLTGALWRASAQIQ